MATAYRIKDWDQHYEKSETRKVRTMSWFPVSVKRDGKSFRRIMSMPDGTEIYGAWVLTLSVAACMDERGVLMDGTTPITPEDIYFMTGCPEAVVEAAWNVLCDPKVGWMEAFEVADDENKGLTSNLPESPGTSRDAGKCRDDLPASPATPRLQDRTGQDITGQDNNPPNPPKGGRRFEKPSLDDVREYCSERNNGVDAEVFWDFYESKGWKVGKSPMKDWKASVRTWEKSSRGSPGKKLSQDEEIQEFIRRGSNAEA